MILITMLKTSDMDSLFKLRHLCCFSFLLLSISTGVGFAQTNFRVVVEEATIFTDPALSSSHLSIRALKGDIFEARKVRDEWVQIHLFSGVQRYIKRSAVKNVHEVPPYLSDPSRRSSLCRTIEKARHKAYEKALLTDTGSVIPQSRYENWLTDKYILQIFRTFKIPPAHYAKLLECENDQSLPGPVFKR